MRSNARLRTELKARSGHDFENFFIALLGELMDGPIQAKRLGQLDRKGVDGFVLTSEDTRIEIAIQCKGFEEFEYGADQQRQCLAEISKFRAKGPTASEYWLVINRPIKVREMREQLERDLQELVNSGKVSRAELLDQEPLAEKLSQFGSERI